MRENVFEKHLNADINGSIVWIPMLDQDNVDAAILTAKAFSDDRVHHYFDANREIGKTIAESVGWQGHVAWDIYLFYAPTVKWTIVPPPPTYWMHQLKDEWSTSERYRTGADLKNELSASMENMLRY